MTPPKVQARADRSAAVAPNQPAPGLTAYVDRLKGPVEFACRAAGAKLGVVRNLGAFLVHGIADGLAVPELRSIHPQLRRLQSLLDGYDGLPIETRRDRLQRVRDVLEGLRRGGGGAVRGEPAKPAPLPIDIDLAASIQDLPGVGSRKAASLARLGVERIGDLLWMLPWRYVDRAHPIPLGSLRVGEDVTVCGTLLSVDAIVTSRRALRIVQALLGDSTGTLALKWFNQSYLGSRLAPGQMLMCSGRVKLEGLLSVGVMENPQFEILAPGDAGSLHTGRLTPIYHETRGLNSRALRVLVDHVLATAAGIDEECLPEEVRTRHSLLPRPDAIRSAHFPPSEADLAQYNAGASPAHRRLAFEELFLLEIGLAMRRSRTLGERDGVVFRCDPVRLETLWSSLPFQPTGAQRRVVGEVLADMAAARPMNRLIQGDVGCGKTLVAAAAIWMAAGDGYQSAVMAPTELLAEQHHRHLQKVLGELGVRVAMVTSDLSRRERSEVLNRLSRGEVDCLVGTHAVVQPDVRFARFGLAVIDEQHKFGVLQRSHLVGKGYHPDVLIMTATPIPRTLALSVYGDLDISVIDELPAGRRPVETRWYGEGQRRVANDLVLRELRAGRQTYVVAPLVEGSAEDDARSAVMLAARLRRDVFADARVGLLHGRLNRAEKDLVMRDFLRGDIQVLVATTIVEVGIDVPNATVMMIEHADRYGLAQLHQLRGRVGRGGHSSVCILMSGGRVSDAARERLEAMVAVQDGFVIAERDLALRGPGELMGTRQSGLPDLKVAHLVRDARVLEQARTEAFDVVRRDPQLADPRHAALRAAVVRTWGVRLALGTIG